MIVRRRIYLIFCWIHDLLHKPLHVLLACIVVASFSLILEGSIFQLWSLHRDSRHLSSKIQNLRIANNELDMKIQHVSDPNFIEFEVRKQLDYVQEGDLVFIFTESN